MEYLKNTRWVVKINESKTKRVLIEYFPLKNKFVFTGQLKVGDYQIDFSKKTVKLGKYISGYRELEDFFGITTSRRPIPEIPIYDEITVDNIDIDGSILEVFEELNKNIEIHSRFSEYMKEYKEIKITEENIENNS